MFWSVFCQLHRASWCFISNFHHLEGQFLLFFFFKENTAKSECQKLRWGNPFYVWKYSLILKSTFHSRKMSSSEKTKSTFYYVKDANTIGAFLFFSRRRQVCFFSTLPIMTIVCVYYIYGFFFPRNGFSFVAKCS